MFVYNSFNGGIWLFGPAACELYACLGNISCPDNICWTKLDIFLMREWRHIGSIFGTCSICTMAVISYDRYNVIVKGMAGTRMTASELIFHIPKWYIER